jgi:FixJ family two-component response regulator
MSTSHGTLFVIDDDSKSRKAVAALASSMKIRCETFAFAEGFLERYDPSLTGCALIDFHLGGMDGLQLQERLRTMGSALSVILVSAYADMYVTIHAMKNGAVAFIEKPYKNDELADAIRKALDRCAQATVTGQASEGTTTPGRTGAVDKVSLITGIRLRVAKQ